MEKTEQEINDLKRQWESDPIWDIEETEGFEDCRELLLAYRLETEAKWKASEDKRIATLCSQYGCNPELLKVIESLQRRIEVLEQKVN
jgi:hypothetical protein